MGIAVQDALREALSVMSTNSTGQLGTHMAENANTGALVTVPADVILQELGDEIVLANLETGVYFALNEVAARTWTLLRDAPSIDAVIASLLEEYEIDEATLRADVQALLQQFEEHGLMSLNRA